MLDPLTWYLRLVLHYTGRGPYLAVGGPVPGYPGPEPVGRLLRLLAEHGPASGLVDTEETAGRVRAVAPGCPVHVGAGAVPSGAFRGLVAVDVLGHTPDPGPDEKAVAEWWRVLRPGGRAIVGVPDPGGRGHQLRGDEWSGLRPGNRPHEEWRRLLTAPGFTVHREGSDGLGRGPYNRIPPLLDPRTAPARTQHRLGTLFLNPGEGESSVFVLEKPGPG